MDTVQMIIAMVFMAAGMVFCLITLVGYWRFPDFYSRCHASGLSETLALMCVCIGAAVYSGFNMVTVKVIILFLAVCICNPIGSHVLVRAAYASGHPMAGGDKKDQLHAMQEVENKSLTNRSQAETQKTRKAVSSQAETQKACKTASSQAETQKADKAASGQADAGKEV